MTLTRLLLDDKCPIYESKRSIRTESLVSNDVLSNALKCTDPRQLDRLVESTNRHLILLELQIVGLKKPGGERGRSLIDLGNNEDRSYAEKWKSLKTTKVKTMQESTS